MISASMLEGTSVQTLDTVNVVLQATAELAGAAVPGFGLIFLSFKAVHNAASCFSGCAEESARLKSYCDTMTTALNRFKGKITRTVELDAAFDQAAAAVDQLTAIITKYYQEDQCRITMMFTSVAYKSASEKAKQDVEKAVRKAMDVAQQQGMEDLVKSKEEVELLLNRRCVRALASP
jgi:hypothetical protein